MPPLHSLFRGVLHWAIGDGDAKPYGRLLVVCVGAHACAGIR